MHARALLPGKQHPLARTREVQGDIAFVTACAGPTGSPVQSYASNIANTQWDFSGVTEHDLAGSDGSGENEPPSWYTKWESEMNSSSSATVGYISCVLAVVASVSLAVMSGVL